MFVRGANGILFVVFICQLLLLIDAIVALLIFTYGFSVEVTTQITLLQSQKKVNALIREMTCYS